jgi:hypothetical protein
MRFVYVLEDNERFQKEIVDAIQNIDPKIQIRLFGDLEEFVTWIKSMVVSGASSITLGGLSPLWIMAEPVKEEAHQLVAVISKIEFLGPQQLPLLKKTRDQFIKKKLCTEEDPTAFVLTTFDEPDFKIKDLHDRILNNVIFKPFDRLILIQHLTFAIDGRHAPSKYTISNQKTTALVEMLKDVKMEGFSEVGFVTRSSRLLETKNEVSKYYSAVFKAESKVSIMGSLLSSVPDKANPNEFICTFSYFALSPLQISLLRKKVRSVDEVDFKYDWGKVCAESHRSGRPLGVVIIDEVEASIKDLSDSLTRKFPGIEISAYKNMADFILDLDPKLVEKEKAPPPKALPQDKEITFIFDAAGHSIVDVVRPGKDALTLFGLKESEIKALWWSHALGIEGVRKWKEWMAAPKDQVLILTHLQNKFYIKPKIVEKDQANNQLKVIFTELNPDEKNQFFIANSKIPKITDALIVSHRFVSPEESEKWIKIKDVLKVRAEKRTPDLHPELFVMSSKDFSDADLRLLGGFVRDIFYRPMDRAYIAMKFKLYFPELPKSEDTASFPTLKNNDHMHTANPVQISEISEAGLVMQYYRAINLGAFREFVLWHPYEIGAPKLVGTCNFTEENQATKGTFNNQFVFFGMTDHFLKSIRIWIRDNYILSKENG